MYINIPRDYINIYTNRDNCIQPMYNSNTTHMTTIYNYVNLWQARILADGCPMERHGLFGGEGFSNQLKL